MLLTYNYKSLVTLPDMDQEGMGLSVTFAVVVKDNQCTWLSSALFHEHF